MAFVCDFVGVVFGAVGGFVSFFLLDGAFVGGGDW